MATRGDIRDAFTSELKAVSGTYNVTDASGTVVDTVTLDGGNIGLREPEGDETLPGIVYHENYTRLRFNDVGASPDMIVYNPDGTVKEEVWREYIEAQFVIDVRASSESEKEPLYEALRSRFGQYQFTPWDETSLHDDVNEVLVEDATSVDTGNTEDAIRGDRLEVRIRFYRNYAFSTDNITGVNTAVDADDDGTVDYTYTTN